MNAFLSGKKALNAAAVALATMCASLSAPSFANPEAPRIVSGSASISQAGNTLSITNSPSAILEWDSFSIGAGEVTQFLQDNANSAVLNRVTGNQLSQIHGALNSNGRVFLINPAGIVVGPSGTINTASFFASTHNIANNDFLDGGSFLFDDTGANGAIVNLGKISASGGDVFLIANQVSNQGEINAPNGSVGLVAASGADVLLADGEDRRVLIKSGISGQFSEEGVVNEGTIEASKVELAAAGGNVYALAIRNDGRIRASTVEKKGGRILLVADQGEIQLGANSELDASGELGGGKINVGGDQRGQGELPTASNLTVDEGASIRADAITEGDGGEVILFSEDTTVVAGNLSARGGSESGDGGFIEVSGKQNWRFDGWLNRVDISAANGSAGAFLIDPNDIQINSGASAGAIGGSPTNANTLVDTDINNFLQNSGSLIIETSGSGGSGDMFVNSGAAIAWSSASDLTLTANRRFSMNTATINASGGGAITINNTGASSGTAVTITGSTISSTTGDITITGDAGTSNTNSSAGVSLDNSTIQSTGTGTNAAAITITGTGSSYSSSVFGGGDSNYGVYLQNGAAVTSVDGDISITGTGGNLVENSNAGVRLASGTSVTSTGLGADAASITISGTSRNRRAIVTEDCFFPGGCTTGWNSASGAVNPGIYLEGDINAVNGNVTLTGQTGSSHRNTVTNAGIFTTGGNVNMTGDGDITIQAISPATTDFYVSGTSVFGGADALGDITIIGNEFQIDNNTTLQSRGNLSISANTASTSIGIGDGAGTLSIDAAEFARFVDGFASISVGDAVSGSGTVNVGAVAISDGLTVFGGTVNDTGPVTAAGTANVITGTPGTAGSVNFVSYADPTANGPVPPAPAPPTPPPPPPPPGGGSGGGSEPPTDGGGAGPVTPSSPGDDEQVALGQLNAVQNGQNTSTPAIDTTAFSSFPEHVRLALTAATSRAQLLQEQKSAAADYLAREDARRAREIALRESNRAYALKQYAKYQQAVRDGTYVEPDYGPAWFGTRSLLASERRDRLEDEKARKQREAERLAAIEAREAAIEKALEEAEQERLAKIAEEERLERERLLEEYRSHERNLAHQRQLDYERRQKEMLERLAAEKREREKRWFINGQISRAGWHMREGRLLAPEGKSVLDVYKGILEKYPDDQKTKDYLVKLRDTVLAQIDESIDFSPYTYTSLEDARLKYQQAEARLALAEAKLGPSAPLEAMKLKLKEEAQEAERVEQARLARIRQAEQRRIAAEQRRLALEQKAREEAAAAERARQQALQLAAERTARLEAEKARQIELAEQKRLAAEKAEREARVARARAHERFYEEQRLARIARKEAEQAYQARVEQRKAARKARAKQAFDEERELESLTKRSQGFWTAAFMTSAEKARLEELKAKSQTEEFQAALRNFKCCGNPEWLAYRRATYVPPKPVELTPGQKWAQRNAARARARRENQAVIDYVKTKTGVMAAEDKAIARAKEEAYTKDGSGFDLGKAQDYHDNYYSKGVHATANTVYGR